MKRDMGDEESDHREAIIDSFCGIVVGLIVAIGALLL